MKRFLLSATVAAASIAFTASVQAEERTVIEITRSTKAQASVSDVVRVSGKIAAGQGEISVDLKGPGKLVATNSVRQFANSRPLLGLSIKEFEIRAEDAGQITITVTVSNKIQRKEQRTEYMIEVK